MNLESRSNKFVIYYNALDIFLGTALLILVVFFIQDYLSHTVFAKTNNSMYKNQMYGGKSMLDSMNQTPGMMNQ